MVLYIHIYVYAQTHTRLKSKTLGKHAFSIEVYNYHEDGPLCF